jgi:hypothetical protein
LELSVATHRAPRIEGVVTHRSLHLPSGHCSVIDGVPVTTVERTLADLGAVVHGSVVARSVQDAVVRKRTTVRDLYGLVDDHARRGRSGMGALRAALDDWVLSDRPPESPLELMFARLVERGGLPMPVLQHEIRDEEGLLLARVDAAWPERRLAVEVDGLAHHGTAVALQRDLRRQNAVILAGWTMLRFTWNDVVRYPSNVVRTLRAAVMQAAS